MHMKFLSLFSHHSHCKKYEFKKIFLSRILWIEKEHQFINNMMQTAVFYPYSFFKSFTDFKEYFIMDKEECKILRLWFNLNTKIKYRN